MKGNFLPVSSFAMFYEIGSYHRQAKVSPQTPLDQRGLVEQR